MLYLRPVGTGKRDNEAETERDLRNWAGLFLEVNGGIWNLKTCVLLFENICE